MNLLEFLADNNIICSMAEGRRLLAQDAVRIDSVVTRYDMPVLSGQFVEVGKRISIQVTLDLRGAEALDKAEQDGKLEE